MVFVLFGTDYRACTSDGVSNLLSPARWNGRADGRALPGGGPRGTRRDEAESRARRDRPRQGAPGEADWYGMLLSFEAQKHQSLAQLSFFVHMFSSGRTPTFIQVFDFGSETKLDELREIVQFSMISPGG